MNKPLRLGVNIDHIATLRQARRTPYPDLLDAVQITRGAGADCITLHLREDRRHIQDADVEAIGRLPTTPMNLEMAATGEMVGIAKKVRPKYCCIVPERREELTTEGGLDVGACKRALVEICGELRQHGIRVSLFVEPEMHIIDLAAELGVPTVELHTGIYANAPDPDTRVRCLEQIKKAAQYGVERGLQVNAGHGLDYDNVIEIARIPEIAELNIGHSIVSRAIFVGLKAAVGQMKALMSKARQ